MAYRPTLPPHASHAPRMHVSASCDPPAVHARPQRPCGDLALASPRMSSPLTLLTLSHKNTLPSGALMLTGMMGFERHERIGCGWDGTASVTHSAPPMDGPSSGWRMIRCAMDGGWWTGAGRDRVVWDGHGWMVCSLSRSLTLPSLVSCVS